MVLLQVNCSDSLKPLAPDEGVAAPAPHRWCSSSRSWHVLAGVNSCSHQQRLAAAPSTVEWLWDAGGDICRHICARNRDWQLQVQSTDACSVGCRCTLEPCHIAGLSRQSTTELSAMRTAQSAGRWKCRQGACGCFYMHIWAAFCAPPEVHEVAGSLSVLLLAGRDTGCPHRSEGSYL